MSPDCEIIVIGAGAAGLAAVQELSAAGLSVRCLEARDRIGGRILTVRDPLAGVPIELGAEFLHGRPPQIWDMASLEGLRIEERSRYPVYVEPGKVRGDEVSDQVERVLSGARTAARERGDESFSHFLARSSYPYEVKRWAASYVEGFNAARGERIGIAGLAEAAEAAEQIDGDRMFSIADGYDWVPRTLSRAIPDFEKITRLGAIVDLVQWQPGRVAVHVRSAPGERRETLHCRQLLVTVPLGVLQAESGAMGGIRFDPEPSEILSAARALEFGSAWRITFRFETAFWEARPEFAKATFFYSQEPVFPTWWKPAGEGVPILTGWSAGLSADELAGRCDTEIMECAVAALERIVGLRASRVEAAHFYDWQADPFARGAYSYVPAGRLPDRNRLAQPVRSTLYFAGEATECSGHSGTVHGAIASGRRAARQALADYRKICRLTA